MAHCFHAVCVSQTGTRSPKGAGRGSSALATTERLSYRNLKLHGKKYRVLAWFGGLAQKIRSEDLHVSIGIAERQAVWPELSKPRLIYLCRQCQSRRTAPSDQQSISAMSIDQTGICECFERHRHKSPPKNSFDTKHNMSWLGSQIRSMSMFVQSGQDSICAAQTMNTRGPCTRRA
jgi:predicted GNAT family acetyltransferase